MLTPTVHAIATQNISTPASPTQAASSSQTIGVAVTPETSGTSKSTPGTPAFGAEIIPLLLPGDLLSTRALELGMSLTRLGSNRISWRQLQPNQGDPINWALLTDFESELRNLHSLDINPVVIVYDYPAWATDNSARWDGQPTSCGPLRDDRLADFAAFFQAVVARYKTPEFNVHAWELGNEPDVDPNLVAPNSGFGCWGNIEDQYYGGERYGRMVITIGQAIKAIDPSAQIWLGGLLLNQPDSDLYPPNCGLADCGHSERFFQGILQSGAAPYFDVVPYHIYQSYLNQRVDHDLNNPYWINWGGGYLGKARFLRSFMQQAGVTKPVSINETALNCPNDIPWYTWCDPPGNDFYQMQADYLVRSFMRGFSENISSYIWYTLSPAWRYGSLLDDALDPRPAYFAYQQLIIRLRETIYIGPVTYGDGIEAYAFDNRTQQIQVIWSITNTDYTITLPQSEFIAAYTRDGTTITPTPHGSDYQIPVQFEPIYLVRSR